MPAACLVGKTWDWHVDLALGTTNDEAVKLIRDSGVDTVINLTAGMGGDFFFDPKNPATGGA